MCMYFKIKIVTEQLKTQQTIKKILFRLHKAYEFWNFDRPIVHVQLSIVNSDAIMITIVLLEDWITRYSQ